MTHDHAAHHHAHDHDHHHGHAPHGAPHEAESRARPAVPGFSFLRQSALARIAWALAASAVVWAGVLWAMD